MVRLVVEGLDDGGGRMIARKSARGLAHYRTLRAEGCLPANEDWGKDKLWAARQRRPYQGDVRPHPGLLPREKGNGSADLTFYGVHPKRGTEAMEALGVIGACRQWVVQDHWKPYFTFAECLHALCNQHLLRELKFLWEEQPEEWARALSDWLLAQHRRRQPQGEFTERQYKRARRNFRAVVRRGRRRHPRRSPGQGRGAQSKAANLLDRLEDFADAMLAFLWDVRVPFTNHQAEQDIRMIKVRQKISGCFRTLQGAEQFCRIRSYLSTCRKQGHNLWQAIQRAVVGRPFLPAAPPTGP